MKETDQKTLKHAHQEIVHIVLHALNEWDPYELIDAGAPENEFTEEATRIAAKIKKTETPTELAHVISDVFSRSFGSDVFSIEECLPVASRILLDLEVRRLL
jgi:hypothetical protein